MGNVRIVCHPQSHCVTQSYVPTYYTDMSSGRPKCTWTDEVDGGLSSTLRSSDSWGGGGVVVGIGHVVVSDVVVVVGVGHVVVGHVANGRGRRGRRRRGHGRGSWPRGRGRRGRGRRGRGLVLRRLRGARRPAARPARRCGLGCELLKYFVENLTKDNRSMNRFRLDYLIIFTLPINGGIFW